MDPSIPRQRAKDADRRREAARCVSTAKDLLVAGNPEHCWQLAIRAHSDDPCADALIVAATALRATNLRRLPSGAPEPYAVFGLDPFVSTARDPAVIQSYYRRASDLLNRCHPRDPCSPAFADAARLVADAWAFLSDPVLKAAFDSRFEAFEAAVAAADPVLTARYLEMPPQPAPPPPAQAVTAQAGSDGMGRGKRRKKPVKKMSL